MFNCSDPTCMLMCAAVGWAIRHFGVGMPSKPDPVMGAILDRLKARQEELAKKAIDDLFGGKV
jgi:hypothetical protein